MHFPQTQVVTLIESLVYALAYMQKNNYKHHDFYPTNIYFQQGVFKITNPATTEQSAYFKTSQSIYIPIQELVLVSFLHNW